MNREKLFKITMVAIFIIQMFFVSFGLSYAVVAWKHGQMFELNIINVFKSFYMVLSNQYEMRNIYGIIQVAVVFSMGYMIMDINSKNLVFKKNAKKKEESFGPDSQGHGEFGTSRFQTEEEKKDSCFVWNQKDEIKKAGILFGFSEGNMYMDKDDVHTLIIGTTRSGKSRTTILPSIYALGKTGESIIVGDPKGELCKFSEEYLQSEGYNVVKINIREPLKGARWNILEPLIKEEDINKVIEMANDIAEIIVPKSGGDPIWTLGEKALISSTILLIVLESEYKDEINMLSVYNAIAEYGIEVKDGFTAMDIIMQNLDKRHPARSAYSTVANAKGKMKASFISSALADLRIFNDSKVADMTAISNFDINEIGTKKTVVFLIIPDEKGARNVLATLFVDQAYAMLVDVANKYGGRLPIRVNYILDEFGNLPTIPNFEKKLTVGGGRGMRFTIAVQDIAQLKKAYKESVNTILGNCHNWLYLLTADTETAELISKKAGKYTIRTESINSSINYSQNNMSSSAGEGLAGRPLVMADELMNRWKRGKVLALRVRNFPAMFFSPDISFYKNIVEAFGLPIHEDIEENQKATAKLLQERTEKEKERKIMEVPIWESPLFKEEKEEVKENKDLEEGEKIKVDLSKSEEKEEDNQVLSFR